MPINLSGVFKKYTWKIEFFTRISGYECVSYINNVIFISATNKKEAETAFKSLCLSHDAIAVENGICLMHKWCGAVKAEPNEEVTYDYGYFPPFKKKIYTLDEVKRIAANGLELYNKNRNIT